MKKALIPSEEEITEAMQIAIKWGELLESSQFSASPKVGALAMGFLIQAFVVSQMRSAPADMEEEGLTLLEEAMLVARRIAIAVEALDPEPQENETREIKCPECGGPHPAAECEAD